MLQIAYFIISIIASEMNIDLDVRDSDRGRGLSMFNLHVYS